MSVRVKESDFSGLCRKTYDEVGGCYGLVVSGLKAFGVDLPANQGEVLDRRSEFVRTLKAGERVSPGDVVDFQSHEAVRGETHLGLVIPGVAGHWVIHATKASNVTKVALEVVLRMMGTRIFRPIALAEEVA